MKKLILANIFVLFSLFSYGQSKANFNVSSGINTITKDEKAYIDLPLKIEFEFILGTKFSFSAHGGIEISANKNRLGKTQRLSEVSANINYALLKDLDLGSSLIANFGFGFFADSDKDGSSFLRFGLTAQKEFLTNKFLFVNANYYNLINQDRPDYFKYRAGINLGIKFILSRNQ
jgi:hypothetical protein